MTQQAKSDDGLKKCGFCGVYHVGRCPFVRAIEYHENGLVKSVEFFPAPTEHALELKPHTYAGSAMHMGDCNVCGNLEQHPIHQSPPTEAAPMGEKPWCTFHGYLLHEQAKGTIDFALRIVDRPDGGTDFYIHPANKSGETGDFEVSGNVALPKPDNLAAGSARPALFSRAKVNDPK